MKKIVRLTEQDLARIVKRVINESPDPTLDFILDDGEKDCMTMYFKKPYTKYEYRWLKSEDGTQVSFGKENNSYLKNYCLFDINNRPMPQNLDQGRFDYNENTGVITFGSNSSLF